jgi:hypothetical protein
MAIQVSGDTVISDTKQLQGITGADATTVSALATSGVGGATKLITDYTTLGNASSYSFSFTGGYHGYFIHLTGLQHDYSARCDIRAQVTNSSGTTITTGYTSEFVFSSSVIRQANQSQWLFVDDIYQSPNGYDGTLDAFIWVWHPQTSSFPTTMWWNAFNLYFSGSFQYGARGMAKRASSEVNNSLILYPIGYDNSGQKNWVSGGKYAMWGIDL